MKALFVAMMAVLVASAANARELGTVGATYAIAEKDALVEIEQKAKGIIVHPTPIAGAAPAAGAVTTAQGNTPASGRPGQSADAQATAKPPSKAAAATGPGAAKDSSKK